MKIQLALDRLQIADAINLTRIVEESIDWVEVGTSLIKEFGMASVRELKQAFPHKTIVADMKTMDNARYEFEMAFEAGADIVTVMGVSPLVTINACMEVAARYEKKVMFDLLNTTEDQVRELLNYPDAIFCAHVSKDEQEESGARNKRIMNSTLFTGTSIQIAAAGGITIDSLAKLKKSLNPSVVIIGSAITKTTNPKEAAAKLKQAIMEGE
ncbi:3-hexulose-6-phosphate synthase [Gottfriedia acidiceleris]|uniref:3-hexulose-6-phosphate synthase n=1 Tax=Gottfriedia acidiceleris TaxID=371036 RepID=UPI0030007531